MTKTLLELTGSEDAARKVMLEIAENPDKIDELVETNKELFQAVSAEIKSGKDWTKEPAPKEAVETTVTTTEKTDAPPAASTDTSEGFVYDEEVVKKKRQQLKDLEEEGERLQEVLDGKRRSIEDRNKKLAEIDKKEFKPDDLNIYDDTEMKKRYLALEEKFKKQQDVIEFLKGEYVALGGVDTEVASKRKEEIQQNKLFAEFDVLQDEFTELKTKVPFSQMDRQYADLQRRLVSVFGLDKLDANKDKPFHEVAAQADELLAAPQWRKKAEESGVVIPAFVDNKAEMAKYDYLLTLHGKRKKIGGTLKGNYLEELEESGKLAQAIKRAKDKAAVDGSLKTAGLMAPEETVTVITPSDGVGSKAGSADLTPEKAQERLNVLLSKPDRGQPWSDDDKKEFQKIKEFVRSGF